MSQTKTIQYIPIEESDNNWKLHPKSPHSMHRMCSRICSFPPTMPAYFIQKYTNPGDVVFDAWSGKATVPFEALRLGRIGIGNDRSPEAYVVARAKLNPVGLESLKPFILKLGNKMKKVELDKDLTELDRKANVFYSTKTFEQIRQLRSVILEDESDESMFVKGMMMGMLHGKKTSCLSLSCSHSYSMSPSYVKKYAKDNKLRRPHKNVIESLLKRSEVLLSDLLPATRGVALNNDSKNIGLPDDSARLIFSSPPYFNVQTYAWCNWLRLWFLGQDYRDVKKNLAESGMESKYTEFMRGSIEELYRILAPGGRCFIVVGDVNKPLANGERKLIKTAEFILPLVLEQGFEVDKILVDVVPANKRVISYIGKDEGVKTERILCLHKVR